MLPKLHNKRIYVRVWAHARFMKIYETDETPETLFIVII